MALASREPPHHLYLYRHTHAKCVYERTEKMTQKEKEIETTTAKKCHGKRAKIELVWHQSHITLPLY